MAKMEAMKSETAPEMEGMTSTGCSVVDRRKEEEERDEVLKLLGFLNDVPSLPRLSLSRSEFSQTDSTRIKKPVS